MTGTLSKLRYNGVVSSNTNVTLKGKDNEIKVGNDFCGNPQLLQDDTDCSDLVDMDKLIADYDTQCFNKDKCKINLASYAHTDPDKLKALRKECKNEFTQIYIQTSCVPK